MQITSSAVITQQLYSAYEHYTTYVLRRNYLPINERPAKGELQEVAPGVFWLAMPMSGSLAFINLYLLEDDGGWWIVDTGLSNAQTTQVWEDVFINAMVVGLCWASFAPTCIQTILAKPNTSPIAFDARSI